MSLGGGLKEVFVLLFKVFQCCSQVSAKSRNDTRWRKGSTREQVFGNSKNIELCFVASARFSRAFNTGFLEATSSLTVT